MVYSCREVGDIRNGSGVALCKSSGVNINTILMQKDQTGSADADSLYSYPDGQVDFAETTETEDGNGNTEMET